MNPAASVALVGMLFAAGVAPAQSAPTPHSRTRVVMLGTGNPIADPDRSGPATAIVVDSTVYLVDAGAGVVRRWAAAIRAGAGSFNVWDIRRLFVTHLHSDHTLGYADLILTTWTLEPRQREPLHVFGPAGIRAMTDHLLAAYAEDIAVRTGKEGDRAGSPAPRDIVISGDAAPPSAIPEQCQGCDILIHEGGNFHRDAGTDYRRTFHTSMEDLLVVARQAHPKLLVLYHQRPGTNDEGLRYIRAGYDGRVVVAKDLDIFP